MIVFTKSFRYISIWDEKYIQLIYCIIYTEIYSYIIIVYDDDGDNRDAINIS